MAQITIPDDQLKKELLAIVKEWDLVPRENYEAYCPPLDDVRRNYFRNHSKRWIRIMVFDRFPEVLEKNGGWAINPSGHEPGMRGTYVRFAQMKRWLAENDSKIDWKERLA